MERAEHVKPRSMPERKTTGTMRQSVTERFNVHFSFCRGNERASCLTGVWRRMCCNSPGGPIPLSEATALNAHILPREMRAASAGNKKNLLLSEPQRTFRWTEFPENDSILSVFLLVLP